MGAMCVSPKTIVSQQQPPDELQGGLKELDDGLKENEHERQESRRRRTLERVQHGVQKKIIRPLTPKTSRRKPKPVQNENEDDLVILNSKKEESDIVPSQEDDVIPPPPQMTDAADVESNITLLKQTSMEYTELICDNLGPLRDVCECDEAHCFICRKRAADDHIEEGGKTVIWIEDGSCFDSEYRAGNYRNAKGLKEGDSVKPCCLCFSVEM
ncbi:uncharacterized protein [Amphiura filiformis]|uniref:uncharacterized protein n=1 Tax=Amphiura filiformis TaxID=82378 RepID=UPI003B20F48C